MSNVCEADILVGKDGQRWYNFFHWMVLAMLGTMLLFLIARSCQHASLIAPTLVAPSGELAPGVINLTGTSEDAQRVGLLIAPTGSEPDVDSVTFDQLSNSIGEVDGIGNWTVQSGALAAGTYYAQAFAIDPDNGVQAASNRVEFTISDAAAVAAPLPDTQPAVDTDPSAALMTPILVGVSNLAAPGTVTLGGSGTPGSQVDIDINDTRVGAALIDNDGNWQFETAELATGEYTAVAFAVDSAGARTASSQPTTWTVGDVRFATPTLTLPEGDINPDSSVTIGGTGSPDTTVEVFQNGRTIGAASVDEDGRWALETMVDDYRNEFSAIGRTLDGAEIGRTSPQTLIVPAAATALGFANGPVLGDFSAETDNTNSATFSWSGSGQPGATVEAFASGITDPIAATIVAEDGTWQLDGALALPAGDYAMTARQTDVSGVVLDSSDPTTFNVPQLATAGSSTAALGSVTGGSDPNDAFIISGSAEPGATIDLAVDGTALGSATADDQGQWQASVTPGAGSHTVSANGVEIGQFEIGNGGVGVSVTTVDQDGENFVATGNAPANTPVEIYLNDTLAGRVDADADGRWTYEGSAATGQNTLRATALNGSGGTSLSSLNTGFGDGAIAITAVVGADSQAQFFGKAIPNSQVQMVIDGRVVDVVNANENGDWDYGGSYSDGQHYISARQFDPSASSITTTSSAVPFIVQGSATVGTDSGLMQLVFADQPNASIRPGTRDVNGFIVDGPAIHLVVDSSYSMRLNLTGDTRLEVTDPAARIAIARRTLQSVISSLPEGVPLSMRAFGHIENTTETTCHTALELPVQPLNRDDALSTLAGIRPRYLTDTPLAASLAATVDDLAGVNRSIVIVLVTDGEESCGGDPIAAVQQLKASGLSFQLDVVGLAVDDAAAGLLAQLAQEGGGRYFDAQSSAELAEALGNTLLTPYQVLDEDGTVVANGVVGGTPLRLPPGRYRAEVLSSDPRSFNITVRAGRTALEQIE